MIKKTPRFGLRLTGPQRHTEIPPGGLRMFLAEPGTHAELLAWSGAERCTWSSGCCELWVGQWGAWRLLRRDIESRRIVAAAQGARDGRRAVLANLIVEEDFRRRGLATCLVRLARQHFRNLQVSSTLSADGAAFFGLPPADVTQRASA